VRICRRRKAKARTRKRALTTAQKTTIKIATNLRPKSGQLAAGAVEVDKGAAGDVDDAVADKNKMVGTAEADRDKAVRAKAMVVEVAAKDVQPMPQLHQPHQQLRLPNQTTRTNLTNPAAVARVVVVEVVGKAVVVAEEVPAASAAAWPSGQRSAIAISRHWPGASKTHWPPPNNEPWTTASTSNAPTMSL
jgi:hypothetical protein